MAGLPRRAAHRIACAVVAAEVSRLRETDRLLTWPDALPIGAEGLGLDSLERLGALGALAETFNLDERALGWDPPRTIGDWIDWIMLGQATGRGKLTVRTSGSTGAPRSCVHAVADLCDEATFLATRFAGRCRVVALVPAHHLYGLIWTALLPAALDIPVVARTLGAPLHLQAGDLVVAVPDQWQFMLRLCDRFPVDVVGVSSAGTLADGLATGLLAAGLTRLVDIYGSSETGGIAMRDHPAGAYDLLPRWRLQHDEGGWQLVDGHGVVAAVPDHVERVGDRALRPIGRRDGAVKVGGHNVWPQRVAQLLREVDGVADAAVRLDDDGRLKAFVAVHAGHDPVHLSARIEHVVGTRLTASENPTKIRFGAALPRNAMGKLEDWS